MLDIEKSKTSFKNSFLILTEKISLGLSEVLQKAQELKDNIKKSFIETISIIKDKNPEVIFSNSLNNMRESNNNDYKSSFRQPSPF